MLHWFMMQGKVKISRDDNGYSNSYEIVEWYDECKRAKDKKKKRLKKKRRVNVHYMELHKNTRMVHDRR